VGIGTLSSPEGGGYSIKMESGKENIMYFES
jgi:hypothetical protein